MATACVHSFAAGAVGVGMAIVALSPEAFLLAVVSYIHLFQILHVIYG